MQRPFGCLQGVVLAGFAMGAGGAFGEVPAELPGWTSPEVEAAQTSARQPSAEVLAGTERRAEEASARWTGTQNSAQSPERSALQPTDRDPVRLGRNWVLPGAESSAWSSPDRADAFSLNEGHSPVAFRESQLPERGRVQTTDGHRYTGRLFSTEGRPYAEAPVARLDVLHGVREMALEQVSLADVNRYQFRRNRSDEAGIPVQSVGAEAANQD